MNPIPLCPNCGAALLHDGPDGNCPSCLFTLAQLLAPAPTTGPNLNSAADAASDETAGNQATESFGASTPPVLHYFGDYELLEEIARGGMGIVYRARQVSLNRIVAVKVLLFGQFASNEFVQRFRTEAQAAANLQHPNIVAIHEIGVHEGRQYFSMAYIEGGHLGDLVRAQPVSVKQAATLLKTIAEAVQHAHQRGVLHRDLKPSNVLIDADGQPRLTDFGLAKIAQSESQTSASQPKPSAAHELTITGQMLGTPNYASPEQAGGRRAATTVASDVYSLGAILYFLLTGRPPFLGESLEQTLECVLHKEPVPPHLLSPGIPRDLETICLKCLEKEPAHRYRTAQDLVDELGRWLNGEPINARPAGTAERIGRWCRRRPALASMIVALMIVSALGLAGVLWQWQRAERNAALATRNARAAAAESRRAEEHAARETAQRQRAESAVTSLELQRVEDLFAKDEITMAMAYLARMVRQDPRNQIAARRLLSALTQRNVALPVGAPLRHDKRVWNAEFSSDGRRIATASLDFTARIWDAQSGQLLHTLAHSNAVRVARFSPDNCLILTGSDDFVARLWDASSGRPLGLPMPHQAAIHMNSGRFSRDGQRIVTTAEQVVRVWAAPTGELLLPPMGLPWNAFWATFTPDGSQLVMTCGDNVVQFWNASGGWPDGGDLRHHDLVRGVALSPNGKWVVTQTTADYTLWDAASRTRVGPSLLFDDSGEPALPLIGFSPEGERVFTKTKDFNVRVWLARNWKPLTKPMQLRSDSWSIEFSPDGQRLLTASLAGFARLWDANTGEPLSGPMEHDNMVFSARFSPDGQAIVSASADQTARIWDARPGAMCSSLLPHHKRWSGAMFSPDGETVATQSAKLWNIRTCSSQLQLDAAVEFVRLCWSDDQVRLAAFCSDHCTRIWDAHSGALLTAPIPHQDHIDNLLFSPDHQWLATTDRRGAVQQWNVHTGQAREVTIMNRDKVEFFAYSPDGRWLVCTDFKDDQARLHDAASGRLLAQTPQREGRILHGSFSPDGHRLLTASEDGTAQIWQAATLRPLTATFRHKDTIRCAKFDAVGRRIVTASDDGTARVWDADTGQPLGEPMTHHHRVYTANFSPDGTLVATASKDGTARVWDAATGQPVTEPFVHHGHVISALFSPDGRHLLTISTMDGARSWDVPPSASLPAPPGASSEPSVLLAELTEAVIGKRVNAQGALQNVAPTHLTRIRQQILHLPRQAELTRWLEWFLADRSSRNISPYSPITVPQYVEQLGYETNFAAWREALQLSPSDGWIYSRLAEGYLTLAEAGEADTLAFADWASRQAIQFAGWAVAPWQLRTRFHARAGSWNQLLEETKQELALHPGNAHAWLAQAHAFEALSRFNDMLESSQRGLHSIGKASDVSLQADQALRSRLLSKRDLASKALGRPATASR